MIQPCLPVSIAQRKDDGEATMANDPPTNLRMGFGYHQARAAGLGGIRGSRSPRQVNRDIEERKANRKAVRHLQKAQEDGEWIPFILHRIAEGRTVQDISDELGLIEAWVRHRRYSIQWRLRNFPLP
jgi:hypothetical protein